MSMIAFPPMQISSDYCNYCDSIDTLIKFKNYFHIPTHNNANVVYLCGNSLGLQPKSTRLFIEQELNDWANLGVEAHFKGKNPWFYYHNFVAKSLAFLVGALPLEVAAMGSLTANLHFLMASFYKPTPQRHKIIIEANAFPSDRYAVTSQAAWHGFSKESIIEITPSNQQHTLSTQQIIETIEKHGNELALVLLSGVQYYTGQVFDIKAITKAAHKVGAIAGFDLAHSIGNIPLELHKHEVDFAAWCSYKYLNSGPGSVAGIFVHEKHSSNPNTIRLAGWWGNSENKRFEMPNTFEAQPGAAGWQVSNAPVLSLAAHWAALQIFDEAGIHNLRNKSIALTEFTRFCILNANNKYPNLQLSIITPTETENCGCQLSILTHPKNGKLLHQHLSNIGIITDWRNPNVIRIAPVPLYNTFNDILLLYNGIINFAAQL